MICVTFSTETQLLATCSDIFMAGTETGSASVCFGILMMAMHPEVCVKVQKELDEVVGRARLPSFEDRSKYVQSIWSFCGRGDSRSASCDFYWFIKGSRRQTSAAYRKNNSLYREQTAPNLKGTCALQ